MTYSTERLELFARLRAFLGGRSPAEVFRLDGRALRFHLGTALADLRVPVACDAQLVRAFDDAAKDLYFLLCARLHPGLRDSEWDQLLLLDGFDPKLLKPVSYLAPSSVSSEGVQRAFLEACELHPSLDAGLLATWIGKGRPARVLVGALHALLRRALDESAKSEQGELTPYLVLLSLRRLFLEAMSAIKSGPVGQPLARPLQGAVAIGLFVALRLAAREAGIDTGPQGLLCECALQPLPQLGGGKLLQGSFSSCHGVVFTENPSLLDRQVQRLVKGAASEPVFRELSQDLSTNKDLAASAERAGALAILRRELLTILRLNDVGRAPSLALDGVPLWQLYGMPGQLENVLATPDRRRELLAAAKGAGKACTNEAARNHMDALALAAKGWHEDKPSNGWLRPAEALTLWTQGASALAVDLAFDRLLIQAERVITHRSGGESESGLEEEHERGRLYLLGLADIPILRGRNRAPPMGHLFCDVKDFTKRTAFLKEAVIADFLQHEFYQPILTAAARHQHGLAHLGDRGGIYLNNLLGDAVSFSGAITALVELAHEIREILQGYGARLDRESSREAMLRSVAEIEARCGERRQILEAELTKVETAQLKGVLDGESGEEPATRIRSLRGELDRLSGERESELSLVRGEKLEAGIFISFGAAPEVSTFEDAVFGAIKVSIAEKINESARGTARNGFVRTRMDGLVREARAQRQDPRLTCPFMVFLSQPLSIPVPQQLEQAVRRAVEQGDSDGAELVLQESVRTFVKRVATLGDAVAGGDIYNGGAALSEEALEAYVTARGQDFLPLRRELSVVSLHPALKERFVFPQAQLRLVCLVASATQSLYELFVFQGRALFKGLEKQGGLAVFEMIPPGSEFFRLLAQHHVPSWLHELEQAGGDETDVGERTLHGAPVL